MSQIFVDKGADGFTGLVVRRFLGGCIYVMIVVPEDFIRAIRYVVEQIENDIRLKKGEK